MKKTYSVLLLLLPFALFSQGIEFFEGTFEEAKAQAKAEEKMIFVDCYTTWCGPCKMMTAKIFPLETVGKVYNQNFIAMKLDMEKEAGMRFGKKYPVSAYPTLYYLDAEGEIIQKVVGAKREEEFIAIGKDMVKKNDQSESYAAKFEEGERDFDFVLKYVQELTKVGKSALGVTNKYLKEKPSISGEQKATLLMASVTEADSKLFDQLTSLKKEVIGISSEEEYNKKILSACDKTVDKAIEYEYEDLLTEAIEKVKLNLPKEADVFEYQSLMKYASAFQNYEDWSKYAKKYFKKSGKNYTTYQTLIADVQGFYRKNEEAKKNMFKWYEELIKCDECGVDEYLTYAKLLLDNGEKERALEVANVILDKSKGDDRSMNKIQQYIKYIERQS